MSTKDYNPEAVELSSEEKQFLSEPVTKPRKLTELELVKTRAAARAKLDELGISKEERVNMRLKSIVLEILQAEAKEKGIPYQTHINSLLFQYVKGGLVNAGDFLKTLGNLSFSKAQDKKIKGASLTSSKKAEVRKIKKNNPKVTHSNRQRKRA